MSEDEKRVTRLIKRKAYEILKEKGTVMRYRDLVRAVKESFRDVLEINQATLKTQVYELSRKGEYKNKVKMVGRGLFIASEPTLNGHTEIDFETEPMETIPETGRNSQPFQLFEEFVKNFLTKMQFNDVNGGQNFRISGKQVDASFGTSGKTYVIVSCTMSSTPNKSLEGKINELRSWEPLLVKGLKEIDSLRMYDKVKLVLATNGLILNDRDKDLCQSNPKVYVWNEQFFEYYEALFDKIGKYAKYELQRELAIKLDNDEINKLQKIPAIRITNDAREVYYLAAINPTELLKVTYVARRERGDQNFYQRMINVDKLNKISYYIKKGKLSFYNNVILSSQDSLGIDFETKESMNGISLGTITINTDLKALWILDGQHRIYGYARAGDGEILENAKIPVSIIVNKKENEQGSIFISVNTNQTKLSEDYKWDLFTFYDAKEREKISAITAKRLNDLDNLKKKVYIPSLSVKKKRGMIGISKIARTINEQPRFFNINLHENKPNPIYKKKDVDNPEKNAERLANFIDKRLSEVNEHEKQLHKFFLGSTGIQIFIKMLSDYFLYFGVTEEGISEYIKCMCKHVSTSELFSDDKKIREKEKILGSRTEKDMFIYELVKGINDQIETHDLRILLLPQKEHQTPAKIIEKSLREFVRDALSKSGSNWYVERVPDDIRSNLARKVKSASSEKLWEFIDIGSIIKVIESSHNWTQIFEKKFINENSEFRDKNKVIQVLGDFKVYRDPSSHGRSISDLEKKSGEVAVEYLKLFLKSQPLNRDESEDAEE